MEPLKEEQLAGQALDHLGLVAGMMKKVHLKERIDTLLPISKEQGAKLTMGERVSGMILNAMGFIGVPLYMFTGFLHDKPVHRLLGKHVRAKDFTDDALGRCLDAIYKYGATKLFSDIAFSVASQLDLLGKTVHVDTTSLTLYGDYPNQDTDEHAPKVTYGYSKANRPDLKQLILTLATTNKADLPIFMAAHSGNAADQKMLLQAAKNIDEIREKIALTKSFIYVTDSAGYEGCLKEKNKIFWLSRVPMQRKEAKKFVQNNKTYTFQRIKGTGYKIYAEEKVIKDVQQRWVLVFSKQAYEREAKTLQRHKEKEKETCTKELWHLSNHLFACQKDAEKALAKFQKALKYHQVTDIAFLSTKKYTAKGRPAKDTKDFSTACQIKGELVEDTDKVANILNQKGYFILATNQLDKQKISDQEVLFEYKGQQKTERGFAFIKDKTFEVSSVFLKKPSRISALMMIMTLTLFVYSLTQYALRQTLLEKNKFVPNQLKKPIQTPTAKWIFFLFRNVQVLYIRGPDFNQELIINLTPLLKRIISYFGTETMAVYGIVQPKAC